MKDKKYYYMDLEGNIRREIAPRRRRRKKRRKGSGVRLGVLLAVLAVACGVAVVMLAGESGDPATGVVSVRPTTASQLASQSAAHGSEDVNADDIGAALWADFIDSSAAPAASVDADAGEPDAAPTEPADAGEPADDVPEAVDDARPTAAVSFADDAQPEAAPDAETDAAGAPVGDGEAEDVGDGDAAVEAEDAAGEAPAEADDGPAFDPLPRDPDGYLPVITRAQTAQRQVAIVVERCGSVTNTQSILRTAYKYGGRVTLCPTGSAIDTPAMRQTLTLAVSQLGDQVEGTAWGKEELYSVDAEAMAEAIWKHGDTVGRVLDTAWQPHFYRMKESRGEQDQRIHSYLAQLGYKAVLHYAILGADASVSDIEARLQPGDILMFDSSDSDLAKLRALIPWLAQEGYAMVTLNELYGLQDNATGAWQEQQMPEPEPYEPAYRTLKQGDYAYVILQMQDQLRALGHLEMKGRSTGFYGEMTVAAIQAFQEAEGLPVTGEADPETQARLLSAEVSAEPAEGPEDAEDEAGEETGGEAEAEASEEAAEEAELPGDEAEDETDAEPGDEETPVE